MPTLAIAVPYVLFVWWFSTGAVLLLVGANVQHGGWLKGGSLVLFAAALAGIAASGRDVNASGAYCAFTCAILLWGAVEISLLAGWITGPRPQACPRNCAPADRIWYALQAIAYHELLLIGTAALVFFVSASSPNKVGWWTFAALFAMRESAKLNLFLGVRTLNEEMLPPRVKFIGSYFARGPINGLFPLSVSLVTAAAAVLAVAAVTAAAPFERLGLSLLAALVALGALEHWFMVMPIPAARLWRWSIPAGASREVEPAQQSEPAVRPSLALILGGATAEGPPASVRHAAPSARERLEEQYRREYCETNKSTEHAVNLQAKGTA